MVTVLDVVDLFRTEGDSELEIRVGRETDSGAFRPGVSEEAFQELVDDLASYGSLKASDGWRETIDYFYETEKHGTVRTRLTTNKADMTLHTEHCTKKMLKYSLVRSESGCAKVALAKETAVPVHDLPSSCVPAFVRVKQTMSFEDVREGAGVVWRYDLSRTWSGASRSEAEMSQHNDPPTLEVECELVDQAGVYRASRSAAHMVFEAVGELREASLTKSTAL